MGNLRTIIGMKRMTHVSVMCKEFFERRMNERLLRWSDLPGCMLGGRSVRVCGSVVHGTRRSTVEVMQ